MFNRMNVWQRLWLCSSMLALIAFGIAYPYVAVINSANSEKNWEYSNATRAEVESGQCGDYINKEFSQLEAPRYSSTETTCYHIYNSRRFSETQAPYDQERLAAEHREEVRRDALWFVGLSSIGVLIACGIVYSLGWMVAWVWRGFA